MLWVWTAAWRVAYGAENLISSIGWWLVGIGDGLARIRNLSILPKVRAIDSRPGGPYDLPSKPRRARRRGGQDPQPTAQDTRQPSNQTWPEHEDPPA